MAKPKSKSKSKKSSIKAIEGETISVVTADLPDQVRGVFKRVTDIRYGRVALTAEELSLRFNEFFGTFEKVVANVPPNVGGLNVDTITIAVEISAKGTVSLLGTGGEIAGKAGITFTLKRTKPA